MHRSKHNSYFDHLVGALLKNQRQVEAEWFFGRAVKATGFDNPFANPQS